MCIEDAAKKQKPICFGSDPDIGQIITLECSQCLHYRECLYVKEKDAAKKGAS